MRACTESTENLRNTFVVWGFLSTFTSREACWALANRCFVIFFEPPEDIQCNKRKWNCFPELVQELDESKSLKVLKDLQSLP